jgi:hypothetical protein
MPRQRTLPGAAGRGSLRVTVSESAGRRPPPRRRRVCTLCTDLQLEVVPAGSGLGTAGPPRPAWHARGSLSSRVGPPAEPRCDRDASSWGLPLASYRAVALARRGAAAAGRVCTRAASRQSPASLASQLSTTSATECTMAALPARATGSGQHTGSHRRPLSEPEHSHRPRWTPGPGRRSPGGRVTGRAGH